MAEAVDASGTRARVRLEPDRPAEVVCEADATIRVLANLLDNARKYAPAPSQIVVAVSREGEHVRFTVRDGGPGIRPGDRGAVFERFGRANGTRAPGAGLGLYIARRLVRAHGGDLEVGDAPEGGAAFSFRLPTADAVPENGGPAVSHVTVPPGSPA